MACPAAFASHSVWIDKHQYADAERKLHSKVIMCWFRPISAASQLEQIVHFAMRFWGAQQI